MKDILLGVEIECVAEEIENVGSYHEGEYFCNFWNVEHDSSLSVKDEEYNTFECPEPVEFVSSVCLNKAGLLAALKSWQRKMQGSSQRELNKCASFNSTCGCHIHISIDGIDFTKQVFFPSFLKTRNKFIELVKKSHIKSKEEIVEHYYRDHAKQVSEDTYMDNEHHQEWNIEQSERNGKGIEWRGVNLRGIKTWKEFYEMFDIVWDCAKFLQRKAYKQKFVKVAKFKPENLDLGEDMECSIVSENVIGKEEKVLEIISEAEDKERIVNLQAFEVTKGQDERRPVARNRKIVRQQNVNPFGQSCEALMRNMQYSSLGLTPPAQVIPEPVHSVADVDCSPEDEEIEDEDDDFDDSQEVN